MELYEKLLANDPQIRFSVAAINRYKKSLKSFNEEKTGNGSSGSETKTVRKTRQNIMAIDENNKVNYENIRGVPGSFHEYDLHRSTDNSSNGNPSNSNQNNGRADTPMGDASPVFEKVITASNAFSDGDARTVEDFESEKKTIAKLAQTKTRNLKSYLSSQNNTMGNNIEQLNERYLTEESSVPRTDEMNDQELKLYLSDLNNLQEKLLGEYKYWKNKETKMFLKKELLLDANLKVDIFTKPTPLSETLQLEVHEKVNAVMNPSMDDSLLVAENTGNDDNFAEENSRIEISKTGSKPSKITKNKKYVPLVLDEKKLAKSEGTLLYK
ncbi:hypothetical protein ACO0QE_003067 [Hanseniaspora vineae]